MDIETLEQMILDPTVSDSAIIDAITEMNERGLTSDEVDGLNGLISLLADKRPDFMRVLRERSAEHCGSGCGGCGGGCGSE